MDSSWLLENVVVAIFGAAALGLIIDKIVEIIQEKTTLKETMESLKYEIGEVYKILCCGNVTIDAIYKSDKLKERIKSGFKSGDETKDDDETKDFVYIETPIWDSLIATGNLLQIRHKEENIFNYANYIFKELKRIEKKQISEQYKDIKELKNEIFEMKVKLTKDMREKIGVETLENFVYGKKL